MRMQFQVAALAAALLAAAPALAATPAKPATKATAATATAATTAAKLEPEAAAALDRMGAYLRTLKSYEVKSDSTAEEVLGSGQKLQFLNRVQYVVDSPNKIYAEIRNDRRHARIFYNGETLTVVSPQTGYYAEAPMTGTIGQMLLKADENFGINFPLQDLFRWGDPSSSAAIPNSGFKVGPAQIGDNATDHYAFRQDGVDFQIWIDQGDKPLPRKLVITTLSDPAQPEYVAYFTWNTAPKIDGKRFTFVPGKNSAKIPLVSASAAAAK